MNKATATAMLFACGALALTTSATAQESDNPDGVYVGGGWGQFNLDIDNADEFGASVESIAESDDNAWKLFAGYRFNPYVALELAYVDLGRPSDELSSSGTRGNYQVEIAGFQPALIGTIPLGPVELFGKLGYYYYDVDVRIDLDDPGPAINSSHSDSDFAYGGGLGVTLFEHLHLRAEYEILDLDDAPNSDALWLTGSWRF